MTKDEEATKPTEKSAGKTDQSTSMQTANYKQQNAKIETTTPRKIAEKKTKEIKDFNGDNNVPVNVNVNFDGRSSSSSNGLTSETKPLDQPIIDSREQTEIVMESADRLPMKARDGCQPASIINEFDNVTNERAGEVCLSSAEQQAESHEIADAPTATNTNETDRHNYSHNAQQNQQAQQLNNQQQKQHHHHHHQQRAIRKQQQQLQMTSAPSANLSDQQVPISADYLAQLIKDKKQLAAFPSVFVHVQRLIDDEINKVRQSLFQLNDVVNQSEPLELPEPEGEFVQLQEKIYVPVGEHPEYNFVGRLLGPRGMTAKQLEQETGCKIMIRGRGSMRDKKKEDQNRGKANWEHLNDELHVLITVEDTQNRAQIKLKRALEEVKQLLVPIVDGEDELKKRQLMELAIINGTYRDCNYNEALTKMLNDAVYRQTLGDHSSPMAQQQQQLVAAAGLPNGSATGNQRHYNQHYMNHTNLPAMNGSSVSSGVPSTGSNTPNSVHAAVQHHNQQQQQQQQQQQHQQQQQQKQHQLTAHHHHQSAAAAAAAAAAAVAASASAQQHHQQQAHLNSASTTAAVVAAAAAAAAQHNLAGPSPHQPTHPHPHHHHGPPLANGVGQQPSHHHTHAALAAAAASNHIHHHHQSPAMAAAAAAAAAALMVNPADATALMYAQQYHDFHHYASMAAAGQPLLAAPDYVHHVQPHHPHHTPHPQSTAVAVAQAVAAAAANHQLHHHYQQQVESEHHQAALAYQHHQQQQQHHHHHQQQQQQQQQHQQETNKTATDNGNNNLDSAASIESGQQQQQFVTGHQLEESSPSDLCATTSSAKTTVPSNVSKMMQTSLNNAQRANRFHPYKRPDIVDNAQTYENQTADLP